MSCDIAIVLYWVQYIYHYTACIQGVAVNCICLGLNLELIPNPKTLTNDCNMLFFSLFHKPFSYAVGEESSAGVLHQGSVSKGVWERV